MTRIAVLLVIVGLQAIFVILTIALLFVTRMRRSRSRVRSSDAEAELAEPLQRIMLGDDGGEALAAALLKLQPAVAVRELLAIGGGRLSADQRRSVASQVRQSPWVRDAIAAGYSRKWWKRLEAARLLAMVCDDTYRELVARLVTDEHAAVATAATAAIPGCISAEFVWAIVDGLPRRPASVRLQQCNALRAHADIATDAAVSRLSGAATTAQLRAWIQLAEVLGTPAALEAVVPYASHPDVEIRTGAARALRNCFSAEAAAAVTRMLKDDDWRVRAAAARAVGALNANEAIPLLRDAMHDDSWWVRFRAGLALADLSDPGRSALKEVRESPDQFARDMATLVCGLSDGSRLELTAS